MGQLVALLKRKKLFHVETGGSEGEEEETVAKSVEPHEEENCHTDVDMKKGRDFSCCQGGEREGGGEYE